MATVKITLNGVQLSMDAKSVPAFLLAMSGKGATPAKKYVGENEISQIKATSADELVLKALALQDGIHTVYSGLNDAIRRRFNADPLVVTAKLAESKKIAIRPTKGGVVITLQK